MGQAKRRREAFAAKPIVYHHTSTLRSNLIWMSGVIELEGQGKPARHPYLGEIKTHTQMRRAMKDFPALAWFTRRIETPRCLERSSLHYLDHDGKEQRLDLSQDMVNVYKLNRIALGFPVAQIPAIPWIDHPGYHTAEGKELNETACDAGDNPADWYVSDVPVDVMLATEVWSSRSIMNPKLQRWDWYLKDVHNMVQICRSRPSTFIPPAWITPAEAERLASAAGLPVMSGGAN